MYYGCYAVVACVCAVTQVSKIRPSHLIISFAYIINNRSMQKSECSLHFTISNIVHYLVATQRLNFKFFHWQLLVRYCANHFYDFVLWFRSQLFVVYSSNFLERYLWKKNVRRRIQLTSENRNFQLQKSFGRFWYEYFRCLMTLCVYVVVKLIAVIAILVANKMQQDATPNQKWSANRYNEFQCISRCTTL